jgi:uncharacterized protein YkwD
VGRGSARTTRAVVRSRPAIAALPATLFVMSAVALAGCSTLPSGAGITAAGIAGARSSGASGPPVPESTAAAAPSTAASGIPRAGTGPGSLALSSAVSSGTTRAASAAATVAASAARTPAGRVSSSRAPTPYAPARPRTSARTSTRAVAPPAPPAGNPSLESAVLSALNQERAENGLPALQRSAALTTSARRHSAAMAAKDTLSHQLPGEASVAQRAYAAGFTGPAGTENVGETGQASQSGALALEDLLYHDAPHRANILSTSMHAVGIGIQIDGSGRLWLTEDFGG